MSKIFCKHCGRENVDTAKFCSSCGKDIGVEKMTATDNAVTTSSTEAIIKCGNCDYVGQGELARKLVFNILAWMCVFFAPLITIIYFVATHKYRCPKCKSTFVGIKNKSGVFSSPSGSGRFVLTIVLVLVGIAIIGILSSVVLVSLNTAREKGRATHSTTSSVSSEWQPFHSVADNFDVLLPGYPQYKSSDSNQDSTYDGVAYASHSYTVTSAGTTYYVDEWKYNSALNGTPEAILQGSLNGMLTSDKNNKLVYATKGTYGIYDSLDFLITNGTDNLKGRIIMLDQSDMAVLIMESEQPSQADYQKFINSFTLR